MPVNEFRKNAKIIDNFLTKYLKKQKNSGLIIANEIWNS